MIDMMYISNDNKKGTKVWLNQTTYKQPLSESIKDDGCFFFNLTNENNINIKT